MKVLINSCYGGFGFSEEFLEHIKELRGENDIKPWDLHRDDQQVVEEAIKFGLERAESWSSRFRVIDVPDGLSYYITEYDGIESIHTTFLITEDELLNGISPETLELAKKATSIYIKTNTND